jgi:hypothetical protein
VTRPADAANCAVLLSLVVILHLARQASAGEPGLPPDDATAGLLSMPERSIREVWAKLDAVDRELFRRADPVFESAFAAGWAQPYEASHGGGCALGHDLLREREATTMHATRWIGGKALRVFLEREEFPALYVLKDESVRLRRAAEHFARAALSR